MLVKFIVVSLDEISQQGVFLHRPMGFLLAKETGSVESGFLASLCTPKKQGFVKL